MAPTPETSTRQPLDSRVAAVRRFNRFYTRTIGVLDQGHLKTEFSLAQVRVLYELAHWADRGEGTPSATEIGHELGLDAGYLSRMLRDFERRNLISREASKTDTRRSHLRLTAKGDAMFRKLNTLASGEIASLVGPLRDDQQRALLDSMRTIERLLERGGTETAPFVLRPPVTGDLGWVVFRHGELYATEYGWDERFEVLVAGIVADFVKNLDPRMERCWIAEHDGERAGSVFLVKHPDRPGVVKLRLLLVEPSARGLGIGRALVDACTDFARQAGYHTITLWTNSVLVSARRIYEAAGYTLVKEEPHTMFGPELTAQTWEMGLNERDIVGS